MQKPWTLAALGALCAGCTPATLSFILPEPDGALSALVFAQREGAVGCEGVLLAEALELGDGAQRLDFMRPVGLDAFTLNVAFFAGPLSATGAGLLPGTQRVATVDPAGCEFPAPLARRQASLRAGQVSQFSPSSDSGALASCVCVPKRPEPPSACVTFVPEALPLPQERGLDATFAIGLDDHTALVVVNFQRLYKVRVFTSSSTIEPFGAQPGLPLVTGLRRTDGSLYLGGIGGAVWSASVGASLTGRPISYTGAFDSLRWVDGVNDPAEPLELYFLGEEGRWLQLSGGQWTLLHTFVLPKEFVGGVVRLSSHEALAVRGGHEVVRWKDGVAGIESVGVDGETFWSLGRVPGRGVAVGSSAGRVYFHDGSRWSTLGQAASANNSVYSIVPYGEGALVSGENGFVSQYLGGQFCGEQVLSPALVNSMVVLGKNVLLVANHRPDTQELTLTVVRP